MRHVLLLDISKSSPLELHNSGQGQLHPVSQRIPVMSPFKVLVDLDLWQAAS
ncbi:MAG: hypothetical protein Q8T09_04375 [Candidatus Melainabacteria bacterium]|nr:hypothetical protein [Candidatus Melainabacteria bacterium]